MKPNELVDLSFRLHQLSLEQLESEIDKVVKLVSDVDYEQQILTQIIEKLSIFTREIDEIKQLINESIDSIDS